MQKMNKKHNTFILQYFGLYIVAVYQQVAYCRLNASHLFMIFNEATRLKVFQQFARNMTEKVVNCTSELCKIILMLNFTGLCFVTIKSFLNLLLPVS